MAHHLINQSEHSKAARAVIACLNDPASKRIWQFLYYRRVASHDETVLITKMPTEHVAARLDELQACGLVAKAGDGTDARYSARMPKSALGLWRCC